MLFIQYLAKFLLNTCVYQTYNAKDNNNKTAFPITAVCLPRL